MLLIQGKYRQTEQEVLLARLIEKAIRLSNAIDTEALCIVAGERCWHVRCDVHILSHDGGLVDASCIAVVVAIQHFRRPDVTVAGKHITVHTATERPPIPLSILHVPLCMTFSYFLDGMITLVDATLQEEMVRVGAMTITLNKFGEVCQIVKTGGQPVEAVAVIDAARKALVRAREITLLITAKLEEDERTRTAKDYFINGKV